MERIVAYAAELATVKFDEWRPENTAWNRL